MRLNRFYIFQKCHGIEHKRLIYFNQISSKELLRLKNKIIALLIGSILVCQFCGCGAGTAGQQESSAVAGSSKESYESSIDAASVQNMDSSDNSLDAYSYIVNSPLRVDRKAGDMGVLTSCFVGSSSGFYLKKHFFETMEDSYDELSIANVQGETNTVTWEYGKDQEWAKQVWAAGPVLGTDCYLTHSVGKLETGDSVTLVREWDEDGQLLKEIPLAFLGNEKLDSLLLDQSGYLHIAYAEVMESMEGEIWHYDIVTSDGEVLTDYTMDRNAYQFPRLLPMYDNQVALEVQKAVMDGEKIIGWERTLQTFDMETGETTEQAKLQESFGTVENPEKVQYYAFTLLDENTLLYTNAKGLYRSGLKGEQPELLYQWNRHGINVSDVPALQPFGDGRIGLVYEDSGRMNYLCLEPTTESVEIFELTMAVPSYMEASYRPIVARFNKQYPNCNITLKTDYEETMLLTELMAGKGPVLIDSSLTGFDNQEKLWEPLDGVLEQLGILGELNQAVMELGEINGRLYGIVTDFFVETVVTGDQELQSWDYETFLQCIADRPGLEAVMNSNTVQDGWYFINRFLIHGLDDNYLLDAENGTTRFDSEEFRNVLEIAGKYCERQDYVYPGETMLEGKVLCNILNIWKPEDMELYRKVYGDDINFVGFPTKDGSKHYLQGHSPITIRRTAGKEEKEAACAFLGLLLSYECQSELAADMNYALSVRKDVLQEQIDSIAQMDADTPLFVSGFDQMKLGEQADAELDGKLLYGLIEKAEPDKSFPRGLTKIIVEELDNYFAGSVDGETVIKNLTNRVELYLGEQQ